jgi:hypothetical protein
MRGEVNGIERSFVFVKAYHAHGAFNSATQEANARLVAAAPELLEALVNLRASILVHCPTNAALVVEKEIRAASDAIAKATGQELGMAA